MEDQEAKQFELELERRIYYLKTLYDLSLEIGYQRETNEIIKNLLLMMIGTFGASRGFILLFDKTRRKIDALTQRGLTPDSINLLVQRVESEDPENFDKITGIHLFNEKGDLQGEGEKNGLHFLSSCNLRIWIPLNIDSTMNGGIGLGEKLSGDPYTSDDRELLSTMARQGAVAIENARLQQARIDALEQSKKDLERLNKAKSRALDHLSHELRTPISVIQGNIRILKRKTQNQTPPIMRKEFFESLEKNLGRLSEIQQETDQIIRTYQEWEKEQTIEGVNHTQNGQTRALSLTPFVEQVLDDVKRRASHRNIEFHIDGGQGIILNVIPKILEESLVGLLKNAIENTPDEGLVRILLEQKAQWVQLKVMDFGIGITKENQSHLLDGLFHTLETDLYTSKKPYDFGAGGKGLDLLRIKTYGRRFGFDIAVASRRCIYIPTDRDLCPGRISACPHCQTEDCYKSGGSTFCLTFQAVKGTF
ncbi:MAG: hypothetical protein A2V86_10190 [Deltaproteobacteria bacterium RBG_16_49_23]|nr:MAG: hypothetical protein A2V86_10190 [Deltaproteobacteria bacterium RBG_16_49_23]